MDMERRDFLKIRHSRRSSRCYRRGGRSDEHTFYPDRAATVARYALPSARYDG